MSINPNQRRNSELLHIGNLQLKLDHYQKGKSAYTTDDLHQIANTINKLYHFSENPFKDSVMSNLARDTTNLELKSPEAMQQRLVMIKAHFATLLDKLRAEMKGSAFFSQGTESKDHVAKVFKKIKNEFNSSPKYKDALANRSFHKLNQTNDDFCFKTSLPHAQEIMSDKLEIAARKTRANSLQGQISQEHLIDKPMIGKKVQDPSNTEAITKEQMASLVNKAQDGLMNLLAQEALQISEPYFINKEGGIFACRSATFEERLMSVAGGVVALEYLKHNADLTEEFRKQLIAQELSKQIPKQVSTNKSNQHDLKEERTHHIMQMAISGAVSLYKTSPQYLVGQMVDSYVGLAHKKLDPSQESKALNVFASASKVVIQSCLTGQAVTSIAKEFSLAFGARTAVEGLYGLGKDKPSNEVKGMVSGLLQSIITEQEKHFVSSGVSMATAKMDDYFQGQAKKVGNTGYKECVYWSSQLSKAFRTNSSINAVATDKIIESKPRAQPVQQKQVNKKTQAIKEKRKLCRTQEAVTEEDLQKLKEMGKLPAVQELDMDQRLENILPEKEHPNEQFSLKTITKHSKTFGIDHLDRVQVIVNKQVIAELPSAAKAQHFVQDQLVYGEIEYSVFMTLRNIQHQLATSGEVVIEAPGINRNYYSINKSHGDGTGKLYQNDSKIKEITGKHAAPELLKLMQGIMNGDIQQWGKIGYEWSQQVKKENPDIEVYEDFWKQLMSFNLESHPKHQSHKEGNWLSRHIDYTVKWLGDHGLEGDLTISTPRMPLYKAPKTPDFEATRNQLQQERAELYEMEKLGNEQSQPSTYQPMQDTLIQREYEAPISKHEESKYADHGSQEVLGRYPEQYETDIPEWLRYGVNPDQSSLDPRERIEQNHAQVAALTTSLGKFIGGVWDAVRNWGSVPSPQIAATQKMEDLARELVPYDRMQPGYSMLQTTADIAVDTLGFSAIGGMGASMGRGGMNVGNVQQINPARLEMPMQVVGRNLVEESAFLQRMNQPAWRSGFALEGRIINANKGINRSLNHDHIMFVESGQSKVISIGKLSETGTFPDRGGLTKAGRAFEKHGQRSDTVFPRPRGTVHEKNVEGQRTLDEILNHSDRQVYFKKVKSLNYEECIDIKLPDGRGVRFTKDGKEMIGFLNP